MTLGQTKRDLRESVTRAIEGLDPSERTRLDARICERLEALPQYRASGQVLVYSALRDEVDVGAFTAAALRAGKAVFLPVVGPKGALSYRRWKPGETLTRRSFGVLEPVGGESPGENGGLVLVPGRAFSPEGWRLGRGLGCYDRAMPWLRRVGTTVGVAYGCQVFADVPHGERDERVEMVISDHASVAGCER